MNCLLFLENDELNGSLKVMLKIDQQYILEYQNEYLEFFFSGQEVHQISINNNRSENYLNDNKIKIPIKELKFGLNNISILYKSQPLFRLNENTYLSHNQFDYIPQIRYKEIQTTLGYLCDNRLTGFNQNKETVNQIINGDFQS